MKSIGIDLVKLAKEKITITVRMKRIKEFRLRLWLAIKLIKLASWISIPIEIVEE